MKCKGHRKKHRYKAKMEEKEIYNMNKVYNICLECGEKKLTQEELKEKMEREE